MTIKQITEEFQNDCHRIVDIVAVDLMNQNNNKEYSLRYQTSYQDATNVWIFQKLAEFEIRLRQIEADKVRQSISRVEEYLEWLKEKEKD